MFELFKRMEAEILKNLRNFGKAVKQNEDDAFAANPDDVVSSIFDSSKWSAEISNTAMPFVEGLMTMGLVDAAENVGEAFVNSSSPAVLRAMELRREQIKTVANTVQAEVRASIAESITMGESRSQAVKRVRDQFDARFKADRVVRTETIWAHNEGTTQAWDQSGVVKGVEWDTVEDDRRCPYCAEMHGKTISKGDVFFEKGDSLTVDSPESGNPITLKFGFETIKHPPLHPNCRCQLIPIIDDD
jgi:SPP1 gp7 family putative phage head morphogenesis protein